MYLQSNQPINRNKESHNGFNWEKAGIAFAIGSGTNFMQDVVLNQITKRTKDSKNPYISKPSQFYQDLMASDIKGKLSDNVGVQRMVGKDFLNSKLGRNTLGRIPNMVPGTTVGKVMGYGVVPLAGAVFAGLTGKTTTEVAAKTLSGKSEKKYQYQEF